MSYSAARKLTSRQLNANLRRALKQSEGKRVVNSRMLKKIFLESKDTRVLKEVFEHFVARSKSGDVQVNLFLNRCISEKFNKNADSRREVLKYFKGLAGKGDSFGLKGLIVGVKDSVASNREVALAGLRELAEQNNRHVLSGLVIGVKDKVESNRRIALMGLRELAERGDARTLPGLMIGVRDSNANNRGRALEGLKNLARKGDARVLRGLMIGLKDSDNYNRIEALIGLELLAEKGNFEAKKALNGLKKK